MDFDLSPKFAQKIFEGEPGSVSTWLTSEFPLLGEAKVGAAKLVLQPRGLALPHYTDSSKLIYVIQGKATAGLVQPNSTQEVVLNLKKGDVVPATIGALSWWYNNGDSEFIMVLLGETSKTYVPGQFCFFMLTGVQGMLPGFSTEFITRAYKINEKEANILAKSQTGALLIKVEAGQKMPQPSKDDQVPKMLYNIDDTSPDVDVEGGGTFKKLTATKFPILEEAGLSFSHVKLEPNAMYSPTYTADGEGQIFYVVKGSGRVQIVGLNGQRVLDTKVVAEQLLVVPKFFVAAQIAGDEGMEFVSVVTATCPTVAEFASKKSVWNALSPLVAQVALGVSAELEEVFKSNIGKSSILIPPRN